MRKSSRQLAVAGIVLAAAGCAGCNGGDPPTSGSGTALSAVSHAAGPLGPVDGMATQCLPKKGQTAFTEGVEVLTNHGSAPVKLTTVSAVDAKNATLKSARVTLLHGNQNLFGFYQGWPPKISDPGSQKLWHDSVAAAGATLTPGASYNMLLTFATEQPQAESEVNHVRIGYSSGSTSYVRDSNVTYVITQHHACSPADLALRSSAS
jgi:hypothetical protein